MAGVLCFLLPSKKHDEYQDMLYDNEYDENESEYPDEEFNDDNNQQNQEDFYYVQGNQPTSNESVMQMPNINNHVFNDDVSPVVNSEPPKLRRRMAKTCPECGAVVSRENRFCPTCGTKLFVAADVEGLDKIEGLEDDLEAKSENIQSVNETLFTPNPVTVPEIDTANVKINNVSEDDLVNEHANFNFNANDGDEMSSLSQITKYW